MTVLSPTLSVLSQYKQYLIGTVSKQSGHIICFLLEIEWGIDHFDLQRKQIICPDCLDTVPIRYCLYCDRTDRVGLNRYRKGT
jgi:hypothetical protein